MDTSGSNPLSIVESRIGQTLAKEEGRVERFASSVRLLLLSIMTILAVLNIPTVSTEANIINFAVLALGFTYAIVFHISVRSVGYRPSMKYATSLLDVLLPFLVLYLYTLIETPSVALKNYVFYIVFPLLILTAFRYERRLTMLSGGFAIVLYVVLFISLSLSGSVTVTNGGYEEELFTERVTYLGQLTKISILVAFVALLTYLSNYTRALLMRLIHKEATSLVGKKSLEMEMTIGADVQTNLLPRRLPEIKGLDLYGTVRAGTFVSGDYFDVLPLSKTRTLVVVADVSGKGVPAGLIMSEVRGAIHLLAEKRLRLDRLLLRVNSLLVSSTRRSSFVTFVGMLIDTRIGQISYINAGHPPPIMARKGRLTFLDRRTIPLGCFEKLPKPGQHSVRFLPGSTLVAYTDGIFERTNTNHEEFGQDRIYELIRSNDGKDAKGLANQLIEEVVRFGKGKGLEDDLTVAVVRRL